MRNHRVILITMILLLAILSQTCRFSVANEDYKANHLIISEVVFNVTVEGVEWIEIYNPRNDSEFLGDWSLHYSESPVKWILPHDWLEPGEYLIVTPSKEKFMFYWDASEDIKIWEKSEMFLYDRGYIWLCWGWQTFDGAEESLSGYPLNHSWARYKGGYDSDNFARDFYDDPHPTSGRENNRPSMGVEITPPSEKQIIKGYVTMAGTAYNQYENIQKVEIRIDNGNWITAQGTTSWSFEWDTTTVDNGLHTIYARAFDGYNYSTTQTVTVNVNNKKEAPKGFIPAFETITLLIAMIGVCVILLKRRQKSKDISWEECR